jgi:hypothetical protein
MSFSLYDSLEFWFIYIIYTIKSSSLQGFCIWFLTLVCSYWNLSSEHRIMGCFGFCKENDSYTTADKGIYMQNNPAGNNPLSNIYSPSWRDCLSFFTIFCFTFSWFEPQSLHGFYSLTDSYSRQYNLNYFCWQFTFFVIFFCAILKLSSSILS